MQATQLQGLISDSYSQSNGGDGYSECSTTRTYSLVADASDAEKFAQLSIDASGELTLQLVGSVDAGSTFDLNILVGMNVKDVSATVHTARVSVKIKSCEVTLLS